VVGSSEVDSSGAGNSAEGSSGLDSSGLGGFGLGGFGLVGFGLVGFGEVAPEGPAVAAGARTCAQNRRRLLSRSCVTGRHLGVPHAGFQVAYGIPKRLVRIDSSSLSTGCESNQLTTDLLGGGWLIGQADPDAA
jgi:hypothetical protein